MHLFKIPGRIRGENRMLFDELLRIRNLTKEQLSLRSHLARFHSFASRAYKSTKEVAVRLRAYGMPPDGPFRIMGRKKLMIGSDALPEQSKLIENT